jgi:hypothetical protein
VRAARGPLWRGKKAHESIGLSGPRSAAGTDLSGEQGPGAAGHRDLLVLRAGARDAGNSRRARAPKGVRLHRGETLCRVNPMSGAGPRDRQAGEGGNRQEGQNPEGGTNWGWTPRVSGPPPLVSLQGRRTPRGLPGPHEASAASAWSNPEGETKPMEAVGAPAPAGESFGNPRGRANGVAGAVNQLAATWTRERFEGPVQPHEGRYGSGNAPYHPG